MKKNSLNFDGESDYIEVNDIDWDLFSGEWTIDFYPNLPDNGKGKK